MLQISHEAGDIIGGAIYILGGIVFRWGYGAYLLKDRPWGGAMTILGILLAIEGAAILM